MRYKISIFFIVIIQANLFSQHDADSLRNILRIWNLSQDFKEESVLHNDSSLDNFHLTGEEHKQSFLYNNLGNLASAYQPALFFNRQDAFNELFLFNQTSFIYEKNSENVKYFNTRRPYTSIFHTTSTKIKNIQTIELIHSQNINPYVNFGINYDFVSSAGEYSNQTNKINSVSLTGNISKDRYTGYFTYIYNKFNFENSGGYYPDATDINNITQIPYLSESSTSILNQEFSITQKYKFGTYKNLSYKDTIIKVLEPSVSLSYNLKLERKYRIYRDTEDENGKRYTVFNYQSGITNDSTGYKALVNAVRFGSEEIFEKKNNMGFSLIIHSSYYQVFNFKDYISLNNKVHFFENNLSGEIYAKIFNNYNIKLKSIYFFSGYRKNDFRTIFKISKQLLADKPASEISINTLYTNQKSDYFTGIYYSNHKIWENDFANINRLDISLGFTIPEYHLSAKFNAGFIKNYIWFGSIASPGQYTSGIHVLAFDAQKDVHFKVLNIHNNIAVQSSSNPDIISLPIFAGYHSLYFKLLIKNSLLLNIGYDIKYTTAYKALSYDPSIGQFYLENETDMAGNYPFIGLFVNGKIKKNVFLFVHFSHFNSNLFPSTKPVIVNDYPIYGRLFRFGVKWVFKN